MSLDKMLCFFGVFQKSYHLQDSILKSEKRRPYSYCVFDAVSKAIINALRNHTLTIMAHLSVTMSRNSEHFCPVRRSNALVPAQPSFLDRTAILVLK